ncbi:hypothetical protein F4777DRAFT_582236 [Nemania sp. FL0916]|nr:hypothetical protein F4777DRAFT_582236 [Nemania sp. FL0916]
MDQPRQRLACDRCHALKLRCQRASGGRHCARCLKAGSLCIFSAPARLGRPLGSGSSRAKQPIDTPSTRPTMIGITNASVPSADFLSDLLPLDAEEEEEEETMNMWFDGTGIPDGHSTPGIVHQEPPLVSMGIEDPVAVTSHPSPPDDIPTHGSGVSPPWQHQHQLGHDHVQQYQHQHQHQQNHNHNHNHKQNQHSHDHHLMDPTLSLRNTGQPANKCYECSTAMAQVAALESDAEPVQNLLSQLSSLTVTIHSHSRRVHGELRVLQLRLKHKHTMVDDRAIQPISPQEIAAANDCFGTHALIRTNQPFRDLIRSMKKTPRNPSEIVLPSPISDAPHELGPPLASTMNSYQAVNNLLPQHPSITACAGDRAGYVRPPSREHERDDSYEYLLSESTKRHQEAPNSCQLALSLLLNCYLEILDIFSMTFNMIEIIVSHYPSTVPLSTDPVDHSSAPRNILNTSFSIFTATQVTQRLLEMVKKDMRSVWELYQSQIRAMSLDGDFNVGQKPSRVNPAIPMTFRLSWEREAAITHLVEDINHRLNRLMDM